MENDGSETLKMATSMQVPSSPKDNDGPKDSGMPNRCERFGKIDSRENCPRVRPGFVKPIRNEPRKIKNLILNRPSRA